MCNCIGRSQREKSFIKKLLFLKTTCCPNYIKKKNVLVEKIFGKKYPKKIIYGEIVSKYILNKCSEQNI